MKQFRHYSVTHWSVLHALIGASWQRQARLVHAKPNAAKAV
jgi:hypothetical protein